MKERVGDGDPAVGVEALPHTANDQLQFPVFIPASARDEPEVGGSHPAAQTLTAGGLERLEHWGA